MSAANSPDKPPRAWYRPHLSTWVVAALVALSFCFWNVAGYYRDREPSRDIAVWAYGWPATYLDRKTYWYYNSQPTEVDDSLTWRMWEGVSGFFIGGLLLDVVVAVGACLLLGWSFELWRRRRSRLLQVYLSELCVLTAMLCLVLAGGRYLILSAAATERELREAGLLDLSLRIEPGTPEFVHRRLPGSWCKAGDIVVGVRFGSFDIKDDVLSIQMETICRQRGLRSLHLDCDCPSNVWGKVARCRNLEEVGIGRECLSDDDLAPLTKLPRLRKLDLTMGWLTGASLRHVGEMKTLKELSVTEARDFAEPSCLLKREDLQPLAFLPLTKLNLDFNQFRSGECELMPVGQMHDLRELIIRNKRLTRQDVTALQQLSALDDLTLLDCELEDAEDGAILFQGLVKLRYLFVDLGSLSSSTGRAISEIRGLESLVVHSSKSFDDDAVWISQIKSLRGLNHSGDNASSSGIAKLVQLPHLKSLVLWSDGVKDVSLDSFVQMKTLKRLNLNCHHISPAGKKRLERERPDLKVSFGNCN